MFKFCFLYPRKTHFLQFAEIIWPVLRETAVCCEKVIKDIKIGLRQNSKLLNFKGDDTESSFL
jgi:hypothetical protein